VALTILLADDSTTAQNMGKKILTEAGFEVITVSNGAAAVKKIAERRPDLAVLDVYMPGYTGLEVCERLKNAHETTGMPVLLTVGKIEPFKPEEVTRVKADGIIIKPFEASDLLAAIQKLQEKYAPKASVVATAHDPDELPAYERTVKIAAPVFDEQHDESYAAWKSGAEEHVDENLPPTTKTPVPSPGIPTEMEASAAFANELDAVHPDIGQQPTAELDPVAAMESPTPEAGLLSKGKSAFGGAAIGDDSSLSLIADAAGATIRIPPPSDVAGATVRITQPIAPIEAVAPAAFEVSPPAEEHVDAFDKVQSFGASNAAPELSAAAEAPAADSWSTSAPIELEPTSAPASSFEAGYQAEASFEPTSPPQTHDLPAGASDPALITDNAEMATAFPTKFGVENADVVPVGNASDYPELYGESSATPEEYPTAVEVPAPALETAAAAPAEPSWVAEETHLEAHEQGVMLHEEMQQQFSKTISAIQSEPTERIEAVAEVDTESAVEPVSEPVTEQAGPVAPAALVAQPENAPDHELAAAMAAAVGSQMEHGITEAISQSAEAGAGESTMPLDQHTAIIAEVVHRVTERIKPELIAQISREVAEEMARKKK